MHCNLVPPYAFVHLRVYSSPTPGFCLLVILDYTIYLLYYTIYLLHYTIYLLYYVIYLLYYTIYLLYYMVQNIIPTQPFLERQMRNIPPPNPSRSADSDYSQQQDTSDYPNNSAPVSSLFLGLPFLFTNVNIHLLVLFSQVSWISFQSIINSIQYK